MGAPHVPALDATLVDDATRNASPHRPGQPVDDTLLTLDQARVALLGDAAAERTNAWPSIKTLRRAYSSGTTAMATAHGDWSLLHGTQQQGAARERLPAKYQEAQAT